MLNILQKIMKLSNSLGEVDLDLSGLPAHVYFKDLHGKYIACNDAQALTVGCQQGEELLGLTDYDLCWSQFAGLYQANDNHVIKSNKFITQMEPIMEATGKVSTTFCYKSPIRSSFSKKIIGVSGISIKILNDTNNVTIPIAVPIINQTYLACLTNKERMVLENVVRGLTAKNIANKLCLSYRTVETHISNIKSKLGLSTKDELIEKITNQM